MASYTLEIRACFGLDADSAKELMSRTLCVISIEEFKCGNCTHEMSARPSRPYCPSCGKQWSIILPAFLYFALQVTRAG